MKTGRRISFCPQSGQALLVIVLIVAVVLTIGLAVISRSVSDIKTSRQEEESARVFSAAEAGIEETLRAVGAGESAPINVTIGGITATMSESDLGGGAEFIFPQEITEGDTQTFWLANHNSDGDLAQPLSDYAGSDLNVCWEDKDPEVALEVSIFYKSGSDYKIARGAYDYDVRGSFSQPVDEESCPSGLTRGKWLQWTDFGITQPGDVLLALRLRPIYGSTKIGIVAGSGTFPLQGTCYQATAVLPTPGITRVVRQCQAFKAPAGFFDYVLYSGGDLIKSN